jgi:hypothetical protein
VLAVRKIAVQIRKQLRANVVMTIDHDEKYFSVFGEDWKVNPCSGVSPEDNSTFPIPFYETTPAAITSQIC